MKVMLVHNRYRQPGGEDAVFDAERDLLLSAGDSVIEYTRSNDAISPDGFGSRSRLAISTVWSRESYSAIREAIRCGQPDVVHFHNTFPLISPAAYYACQESDVPVVQTLHNYRLLCPAATLLRNGSVCEACIGRAVAWPGVFHSCYRGSRHATAVVAAMLAFHRRRNTWIEQVDGYIALSEFSRQKFIEGGLPAARISVKPNFVHPDPGPRDGHGKHVVFAGRLSPEKGVWTMLEAWRRLAVRIPLVVAGDGPERSGLEVAAQPLEGVRFLGRIRRDELLLLMKEARFLVFPAESYENFPLSVAEAFACGLAVVASRLGAMAEIIDDGRTGLHFSTRDPDDLAAKVRWAWTHPVEMVEMGRAARAEYEAKYTGERNYDLLMEIYEQARADSGR
jgi:glycosyltransferase involved in cell wall biosynthesis